MKFTAYTHFSEKIKSEGLASAVDFILPLGFSSVEIFDMATPNQSDTFKSAEEAKRAGEYLLSKGLSVACYSVGATLYDYETGGVNRFAVERLLHHADIAAALGSPFLHHTLILDLAPPPNAPDFDTALKVVTNAAKQVADYCKPLNLTCLYEDQGLFFNGVEGYGRFYRAMKELCSNVGVCGDIGNTLFIGESAEAFFRQFADEIKHVHVKDYIVCDDIAANENGWTKTQSNKYLKATAIGNGDIDLEAILRPLKAAGYDGSFAFESVPLALYQGSVPSSMQLLEKLYK